VTLVVEIEDAAERSRVAEVVLRDLPEWFGIEESTAAYIRDAARLPTFAVEPDAGFVCLKQHTPGAAELYVMGVRREQQRRGVGRALVGAAESWCRVAATRRPARSTRRWASSRSRSCTGSGATTPP
jgi:GNAT superfamily N-acetyltransferase